MSAHKQSLPPRGRRRHTGPASPDALSVVFAEKRLLMIPFSFGGRFVLPSAWMLPLSAPFVR